MTSVHTVSGDEDRSDKKIHAVLVKSPSMFERAKEEFEAVIGAIHQRKSSMDDYDKLEFKSEKPEDGKKKPSMIRKAKEEIKSLFQREKSHLHYHHHHHGRSDENTPVDEVKEEIEAVIDPKKNETPEKERAGFGCSLGEGLEKICSPWGDNKKD